MNIELLQQVKTAILAEPELFEMRWWFTPTDCGTAACIAGHAVKLAGWKSYKDTSDGFCYRGNTGAQRVSEVASAALELDPIERGRLFHEAYWPQQFRFKRGDTSATRAHRAAKRIDHFIKTQGAE